LRQTRKQHANESATREANEYKEKDQQHQYETIPRFELASTPVTEDIELVNSWCFFAK
jgi:hypothetical protein